MELIKATFNDLYFSRDGTQVVFNLKRPMSDEELQALYDTGDRELAISWQIYRDKRSDQANKYFHVLIGKLAMVLKASNVEIKNRLIREYGQYQYMGDMIPTYAVREDIVENLLLDPYIHYKPVGREGDRVLMVIMRGSHTYNSAEMAQLIDMTVSECKSLGIETLPPEELKRMYEAWTPVKYEQAF